MSGLFLLVVLVQEGALEGEGAQTKEMVFRDKKKRVCSFGLCVSTPLPTTRSMKSSIMRVTVTGSIRTLKNVPCAKDKKKKVFLHSSTFPYKDTPSIEILHPENRT